MISKTLCFIFLVLTTSLLKAEPIYSAVKQCKGYDKELSKSLQENAKFEALLNFIWSQWMKESPTWASFVGYPGYDDEWPDLSRSAILGRKQLSTCEKNLLTKINPKNLSEKNKLTYKLMLKSLNQQISESQLPTEYLPLSHLSGIHLELADVIESTPKVSLNDFYNRLKRLKKFDILVDQTIALLQQGISAKVTQVKMLFQKVPNQISSVIYSNPKDSPIYKIMADMPSTISTTEKQSLLKQTEEAITNNINPALTKLKNFIEHSYLPACRENISLKSLPQGEKWYKFQIQYHTTTQKTAQEIHDLGLQEVTRINQEMTTIRESLNFKGTKKEFHDFIQTDKQFFYESPKELISAYKNIAKTIDPELPKLFSELPRLSYGVRAMADYKAPSAPTAYYQPGSLKSGRPGYFEANTYNLKSRPKWEMEVLTVHEAVPGHHLQISLAQELGELPEFRKHESYTAFVEGWGLYSESLGQDLGLYQDPYSKYGQLCFEMWRAVRLVVDTGIHALGWSKEKALSYFMENVPKNQLQSEVEIDRYITWPGQALAYKIGELKFKELKARAREKLKDQFNIRQFHQFILHQGAMPMDILEEEFNQWLAFRSKIKDQGNF